MIIIPNGSLIRIHHGHKRPIHWQYESFAAEYHNRIGIALEKIETKDWLSIYMVLVGSEKINIGQGWIIYPYNQSMIW